MRPILFALAIAACGDNAQPPPDPGLYDPAGVWDFQLIYGSGTCPGGSGDVEHRFVTIAYAPMAGGFTITGQLSDETATATVTRDEISARIELVISIPVLSTEHVIYTIDATADEQASIGVGRVDLTGRFACFRHFLVAGELL